MTLKDYMKKKYPEEVGSEYSGGVWRCPDDYDSVTKEMGCYCDITEQPITRKLCEECWNRELKEKEPKRKVEIYVNDVIITIATLCMKKEEREKALNTFKVFEKYGVKPMDAIKLMDELREVME